MRSAFVRSAILAVLVCSCSARSRPPFIPPQDREVILQAQMQEHGFVNVLEAVQALRPNWLLARGTNTLLGTPTQVVVYQDDARLGGTDVLASIPTSAILYVRHYNGVEATGRWGIDHGAGVIFIATVP